MRLCSLSLILVLLLSASSIQGDILTPPLCAGCVQVFKTLGCLGEEKLICKILAIKFTAEFGPNKEKFCKNFLCEGGYGKESGGHQCKTVLGCLFTKWRADGICETGKICCAP